MEEKAKSKLTTKLAIGVPAAIAFVLGFLWVLDYGAARNVRVEFQAKVDSITNAGEQKQKQDSSTIVKLQTRLKDAEKTSAELQKSLKDIKDKLERVETNTLLILKFVRKPHFISKAAPERKPDRELHRELPAYPDPPLSEGWGIYSIGYNQPAYHDTIYQRPPVYYYYRMEYGQWPLYNVRKPSWLGIGPSIGAGVNRRGEFVTYLGIGINFNILRFR